MVHGLYLFLKVRHLAGLHVLNYDKGERALTEALQELVLALYGLHIFGKIVQHIVVDPCSRIAKD